MSRPTPSVATPTAAATAQPVRAGDHRGDDADRPGPAPLVVAASDRRHRGRAAVAGGEGHRRLHRRHGLPRGRRAPVRRRRLRPSGPARDATSPGRSGRPRPAREGHRQRDRRGPDLRRRVDPHRRRPARRARLAAVGRRAGRRRDALDRRHRSRHRHRTPSRRWRHRGADHRPDPGRHAARARRVRRRHLDASSAGCRARRRGCCAGSPT